MRLTQSVQNKRSEYRENARNEMDEVLKTVVLHDSMGREEASPRGNGIPNGEGAIEKLLLDGHATCDLRNDSHSQVERTNL